MKNIKYLLVVLAFWGCSSIAFNRSPVEKYKEIAGRTFQYPKKDVFNACIRSLEANGWTVTTANYETGAISGIRREDLAAPAETDLIQQTATVNVVEVRPGQTEVKITAGLRYPNPGGAGISGAPVAKKMPEVCLPFLNSAQETLLKGSQSGVK